MDKIKSITLEQIYNVSNVDFKDVEISDTTITIKAPLHRHYVAMGHGGSDECDCRIIFHDKPDHWFISFPLIDEKKHIGNGVVNADYIHDGRSGLIRDARAWYDGSYCITSIEITLESD
jgi:hypothetical protein